MNEENEVADEVTNDEPSIEKKVAHPSPSLVRNYLSFIGFAITAASLVSIILLFLMSLSAAGENPYADLVTFIFVPSVLVFGLFIVLVGALIERRRRRKNPTAGIASYPILDLNDPRRRRSLVVFLSLTFMFLFMSAYGSFRAFEYTESVVFCGQACHDVMKPEFIAYGASPHAKIRCVECHVGGGAEAYVKAKFNGMHQLLGVITGKFKRPIETPVANMRSATETCQKCHWSEKYHGDELRIFNHYAYDEKNTLNQTRMMIKVGGGDPTRGPVGGIHWHMNIANEIDFVSTDRQRQDIPWVRMKDMNGQVVEYTAKDAKITPPAIAAAPKRRMDCIDCHSRPAHNYLSPNEAVDLAFDAGRLDKGLPFLKAKAVETLARPYQTNGEALGTIAKDINDYYRTTYPSANPAAVAGAVTELQKIYQTYFFPEMKTDYRANPNNIGHYNSHGCFRCHDGQHFSPEGKVIRNECSVCHTTIDQTFAGQVTVPPNGTFQHPIKLGDRNTWQCAVCHKGASTFRHPLNLGDISQFQCADCHKKSN
ncbi:MAG: NapC/NirT family cytochrome c [Pyrinomonadaceae bacterium]